MRCDDLQTLVTDDLNGDGCEDGRKPNEHSTQRIHVDTGLLTFCFRRVRLKLSPLSQRRSEGSYVPRPRKNNALGESLCRASSFIDYSQDLRALYLCVDTLQQSLLRASSFCRHCLPILQKHIHPGQEQYLCSCNKQPLHLKPVTEQLLLTMPLLAIYGRKKSETQLDAHRSFMFTPTILFHQFQVYSVERRCCAADTHLELARSEGKPKTQLQTWKRFIPVTPLASKTDAVPDFRRDDARLSLRFSAQVCPHLRE